MLYQNYDIIIVGCGLSGVVIAEQFASKQNKKILIIDKRDHIGGNCYDYYDSETGILMNKYGAHLFHTNDEEVFEYISKFCIWKPWEHKVLGLIDNKLLPIPPNITTVNELCNENITNEEKMNKWLADNQVKYDEITNGEEMAKSRVGEVLYEKIFKHYTYKQWKKYPEELAPEVLARIPVRNSFDDRYFSDKYQVLSEKGYTAFFQSILDKHKNNIDVKLDTDFFDIKDQITKDQIIIYTGPIDAYFTDKGLPKLEYRSIDFHIERKMNTKNYQPYSVVNYPGKETPYTRCVEYKHFLNQKSDHTVYVKETTTDNGEPYYPVLNDINKELYKKYQKMAEEESDNVHFIGRLASYKYFNMDQAIKNSLNYYKEHFNVKISKFVYFYSNVYEYYNQHIKENLNNIFDIEGIKIDDLTTKKGHTFSDGVSIKIELIIEKIRENMGKHIIFTDATIFINKNKKHEIFDFFNDYLSYDLCFADNNINNEYNIGIILIYCTDKTLLFFENALQILIKLNDWDQNVINKLIGIEKDLIIGKFPKNKIYCNYNFDKNLKDDFLIFKSFIRHKDNIIDNYNQRFKVFRKGNLINEDEYNILEKKK